MPLLNQSILTQQSQAPKTSNIKPVRILQIGDGNFLRAFVDWMLELTNAQDLTNARVTMVQPLNQGIAEKMHAQDNLFTVLLRGVEDGKVVESQRIVRCVDSTLNPHSQWSAVEEVAKDAHLRFVVSNTTEAGIAYNAEALHEGQCPTSFPAKIASLLWTRFKAFNKSAQAGLVFLPCELIEANGSKLRNHVLTHAKAWNLSAEFITWVEQQCVFCTTLVDRIVPGFPAAEANALYAKMGYRDELLVAAEPFLLWVIEGPAALTAKLAEELPLHKAGLEVVWTDDLQPYRTRKVRILNGAHTASALAAYCAGLDTVKEMTEDLVIAAYLNRVMFEEIVPFVPLPEASRQAYAKTIMERFANPYIRHELISIALNSVSKWQVRVLPTVKDYLAQHGHAPQGLAFSLAALLWFYRGQFVAKDDYQGTRVVGTTGAANATNTYPIRDNAEILTIMNAAWQHPQPMPERVKSLLADTRLWGEDLTRLGDLSDKVSNALQRIERDGIKAALA